MLCRLACKNISKSVRDYAVYFLTLVLGVSIFYMFNSLDSQSVASVLDDSASSTMQMLSGVMVIVSIFVAGVFCFLIVYANRFLMKRRKQEFALYMMLGMGKLRISALLVFETLIIGIASLAVGLVLGIALSQALSLIVVSMFEADMSGYVFAFSPLALFLTIFCFSFMYFWVMVFNTISITHSSLADLLRSRLRNERIPYRHPWLCLLVFAIGVLLLSYAYYRVTVGVDAMVSPGILGWMIVLGIVATFLIIWSLSGLLLRIALSRKRFYYRDLNSFTLREIHAHIHSTITAMSIICILLFFTICIFSSAMSANLFTARQLQESLPCDLMITKTMELPEDVGFDEGAIARSRLGILEELEKNGFDRTRLDQCHGGALLCRRRGGRDPAAGYDERIDAGLAAGKLSDRHPGCAGDVHGGQRLQSPGPPVPQRSDRTAGGYLRHRCGYGCVDPASLPCDGGGFDGHGQRKDLVA